MSNVRRIYEQYRSTFSSSEQAQASMIQNVMFRHLIPALGGPSPDTEHSRQPIPLHSLELGGQFLETLAPEKLVGCDEILVTALREKGIKEAQETRLKRSFRKLINWGRLNEYLPLPENIIPQADFILRDFSRYNLAPATPLSIWMNYLKEVDLDKVSRNALQNALIRYFVPAVGGDPIEHKKKALTMEQIERGMKVLGSTPLPLFDKALDIVTRAVKSLGLSRAQKDRARSEIRALLDWGRHRNYLPPLPNSNRKLEPWEPVVSPPLRTIYNPRQIFQAYLEYLQDCDRLPASYRLKSVMLRTIIPSLKGPKVRGKKANDRDFENGLSFLETVSISIFWDIYLDNIPLEGTQAECQNARSIFREMMDWGCSEGVLEAPKLEDPEDVQLDFYESPFIKEKPEPEEEIIQPDSKARAPKHTLGTFLFKENRIKPTQGLEEEIDPGLEKQLTDYKIWRMSVEKIAPGGLKSELNQILQFLGWLHHYKGISLKELRFENFIFKYPLIIEVTPEIDPRDIYDQEYKLLRIAQQGADKNTKLIEEYLQFRQCSPQSNRRYLTIMKAMARYLYHGTLGSYQFPEKNSIPIFLKLSYLDLEQKKLLPKTPKKYPFDDRQVSWEKAVKLVEYRRQIAIKTVNYTPDKRYKDGIRKNIRDEIEIANDLQRFLSLALPVLAFPSRPRTYYDLQIGRTFKEGLIQNKKFYSVEQLKEQPWWDGEVKYYIHHQEGDFKTSKRQPAYIREYGWWAEIPDIPFSDQTTLYMYIHRWLIWGRHVNGSPKHNYFFFQVNKRGPLSGGDFGSRIKNMFDERYGVKVPPQNLRQMFVTHLKENQAPPEVMEAEACALQHSVHTSAYDYDLQHTIKKIQPLLDFHEKILMASLK